MAALSAPAFLRISLTLMRVVVVPGISPAEILQVLRVDLAASVRELLAQPGGEEKFRKAVSYTVRRVQGLEIDAVREAAREAAGEQAGKVVMSTAQELIQQGERKFFLRQLVKKFKTLPEAVEQRIEEASDAELEAWGERVLSAKRLEDVFSPPKPGKGKKPGSGRRKRSRAAALQSRFRFVEWNRSGPAESLWVRRPAWAPRRGAPSRPARSTAPAPARQGLRRARSHPRPGRAAMTALRSGSLGLGAARRRALARGTPAGPSGVWV